MSVNVITNSPPQDCTHPYDHTSPTYCIKKFLPFFISFRFKKLQRHCPGYDHHYHHHHIVIIIVIVIVMTVIATITMDKQTDQLSKVLKKSVFIMYMYVIKSFICFSTFVV